MLPQKQARTTGSSLEDYFSPFAAQVIGHRQFCESPFGRNRIVYADWTASGRGYGLIEKRLQEDVLPFFANTHTGTTVTGRAMTAAYEEARAIIKGHVHAGDGDVLFFCGSGMTDAVCRFQRMLGLRASAEKTVVFVTHMEHHSNHISWLETGATVEVINDAADGNSDPGHLCELLGKYRHCKVKIAAITACSNVTGIQTPYHAIAALMHAHNGYCFVDFASSAPYVCIDMHPPFSGGDLDGIYFSFHKFLGGPGTPGVLIFNERLYERAVPDRPGGGTILYSNPWGGRAYVPDIEQREDGGTPPVLQAIKAALCVRLKEEMGVEQLLQREEELLEQVFDRLPRMRGVTILEGRCRNRLGIVSYLVAGAHYNLIVKILNDRFGIQTRGGCSCAGPYGHRLLGIDESRSHHLLKSLQAGDLSCKPGWVRLSLHPIMTDNEIEYILDAIEITVERYQEWAVDYLYDPAANEFVFKGWTDRNRVGEWFDAPLR
jgi:selenocysteine lyase/cysteine desulfurase